MKNTIKLLGIIAVVAVIVFSMAGCDDGGSGGGGGIDTALWAQIKGNWVKDSDADIYITFYVEGGDYCFGCDAMMAMIDSLEGGVVSFFEGETFNVAVADGKLNISNWSDQSDMNGLYSKE
jgi:hypothetical protein